MLEYKSLDEIIRCKEEERLEEESGAFSRRLRYRSEPYGGSDHDAAGKGKGGGKGPGKGLDGRTLSGRVKSFNPRTCWGFIQCDQIRSRDVFVHRNDCTMAMGELRPNDEVEFELTHTEGGQPKALAVRYAGPRADAPPPRFAGVPTPPKATSSTTVPTPPRASSSTRPPPPTPPRANSSTAPPFRVADVPKPPKSSAVTPAVPDPRRQNGDIGPPGVASPGVVLATRQGPEVDNALARVRVCNVPWTLTWQNLKEAFEVVGEVLGVELDEDRVGQAVITFRNSAVAKRAVEEYHGGTMNGREITVHHVG